MQDSRSAEAGLVTRVLVGCYYTHSIAMDTLDESLASLNWALYRRVIQEELRDVASEDVPPLTPMGVTTTQDRKMVTQLGKMIRIIGDRVKEDKEFQE